ncbi:MAG: hypothetical protein K0R93_1558 [Anaerosolibacter sp.]|nr:hypothetical protein [Anaerosolibacter sp.]
MYDTRGNDIIVLLITFAYMFPILYLFRIIFGLLRKEFMTEGGIRHLRKIRLTSMVYLLLNVILWIPHSVAGAMYYGSTGKVSPVIEWIFMSSLWSPVFSALCTVISSIGIIVYSKNHKST